CGRMLRMKSVQLLYLPSLHSISAVWLPGPGDGGPTHRLRPSRPRGPRSITFSPYTAPPKAVYARCFGGEEYPLGCTFFTDQLHHTKTFGEGKIGGLARFGSPITDPLAIARV